MLNELKKWIIEAASLSFLIITIMHLLIHELAALMQQIKNRPPPFFTTRRESLCKVRHSSDASPVCNTPAGSAVHNSPCASAADAQS